MKFATAEQIKKLQESGPRKKDKQFWEISKKDINSSNYNMWFAWMSTVVQWLEKRDKNER